MKEKEGIVKSIAIFDSVSITDRKHRYYLKRVWDETKKNAAIIMLNPSYADELRYDYSSMRIINFLIDNDYGGVTVVNLFSYIETDSEKLPDYKLRYDRSTDKYIKMAIKESNNIIIAWGSNKNRKTRIKEIINMLDDYTDKNIYRITDESNSIRHISVLKKNLKLIKLQSTKHIL